MATLKLVKNILVLTLVCFVITQIKGIRIDADEEPDATSDASIVYDQRQSGKYNIHVVIKDVAIIEMDQNEIADQNFSDEEYYYDEGDLTIKPINFTPTISSNKPTNSTATTTKPNSSYATITTVAPQTTLSPPDSLNTESTSFINKEMTTLTTSILWNTLIPTTMGYKEPPSTVLLNTEPPKMPQAIDIKPRSKIEPIYAIEEPVLHPKYHLLDYNYGMPPQAQSRGDTLPIEAKAKTLTNSINYKVKVYRSHHPTHHLRAMKQQTRQCHTNQYRDSSGNCRGKRSSSGSILKRLFSMLVTLPFARGEQHNEH